MHKIPSSHISIIWLFAAIVIILSIPLFIITSQNKQGIRQSADYTKPAQTLLPPQETKKYISGYIYIDINQNGERDHSESGKPDVQLRITQLESDSSISGNHSFPISFIKTEENGFFKYHFPVPLSMPAHFKVQLILPTGFKTINTNPVDITMSQSNPKEILEFGIYPLNSGISIPDESSSVPWPTIYKYVHQGN